MMSGTSGASIPIPPIGMSYVPYGLDKYICSGNQEYPVSCATHATIAGLFTDIGETKT